MKLGVTRNLDVMAEGIWILLFRLIGFGISDFVVWSQGCSCRAPGFKVGGLDSLHVGA